MDNKNVQKNGLTKLLRNSYRVFIGTLVLAVIAELIGSKTIRFGPLIIAIVPMMYSLVMGTVLGKDLLGFFTEEESETASQFASIAISLFMAKLGISAGGSFTELVEVGPALILQEFGNIGTIFISVPVAVALGLGRKQIVGATHSINRESNLALITSVYGGNSKEMEGTLSVYLVGTLIGTAIFGLIASITASTNLFHPMALGMASGVGSGTRMAAAVATLSEIYPEWTEQISMLGGASDVLTGIDGVIFGLFIGLPLTNKYTDFWIRRIKRKEIEGVEKNEN